MGIGRYEVCPAGSYKVALVTYFESSTNKDYHWYRQDSDGLWSHKLGHLAISRLDESGNPIIDPMLCDRDNYPTFVGYFAVSPWINYYDGPVNASLYSADNATDEMKYISSESLNQIRKGMTYDEVTEILGTIGEQVGSGYTIYKYVLTDGRIVKIIFYSFDMYDLKGVVDAVIVDGETVIS